MIDYDGNVSQNPDNEKFTSFEIGGEYGSELVIKGSYYNTQCQDRNLTKSVSTGTKVHQVILISSILQV